MGRLAWYAGVSTALAAGVVLSAFNQRANFYSACVYLAQSNLCLMILINLILFIYGTLMYGLQRLCYGALRPIEVEQLYEKGWFAVTETCLAMTIFREEVGAWFLVMFVALLTGKVWGWIGDGRVEVLEQQPPANPRLFHIRLNISLTMSILYDLWLMRYTITTVIQQARPNMMVMFLFEFAILTTSSFATFCRYGISLTEANVVKKQTQERLQERKAEVLRERTEELRRREEATAAASAAGDSAPEHNMPLPDPNDVDEMDIEVPGWEAKGQWVLSLDLFTDFLKLCIYLSFFFILLMFYGIPIHIIRDLFLTARSFMKRLAAFLRYRHVTRHMNERYADATVEDIAREDTCIICREEMRPWAVTNPQAPPAAPGAIPPARPATTVNERSRPKKLPCGHILHLGCLKSWLERQQVCPTCRAPVVVQPGGAAPRANNVPGQAQQPRMPGQLDGANAQAPQNGVVGAPRRPGMRMLNLGPLRLGFGQANLQDMAQEFGAGQQANGAGARIYGLEFGLGRRRAHQQPQATNPANLSGTTQEQLQQIEQRITSEIRSLQVTQQELQLVQLLEAELARFRLIRSGAPDPLPGNLQMPQMPPLGSVTARTGVANPTHLQNPIPQFQRHGVRPGSAAIPSGSSELPPGVSIPEGWSLLPLERTDAATNAAMHSLPANNLGTTPAGPPTEAGHSATTTRGISPTISTSNNTLTPTPTRNPENSSHPSSANSPGNAESIHTPSFATMSQSLGSNPSLPSSTNEALGGASSGALPSSLRQVDLPEGTVHNDGDINHEDSSLPDWTRDRPPAFLTNPRSSEPSEAAQPASSAGPSTSNTTNSEEEQQQEKGKGKAVTVEDAEEAEL